MQMNTLLSQRALPSGTVLNNTYVIKEVLGEGGFGITYLGYHKSTLEPVAIKEYFPSELASRVFHENQYSLQIFQGNPQEDYHKGMRRFLTEAKHLQELEHLDSIVSIFDSFEEGNTAYIIMEYIEGPTLYQYIKENGPFLFPEFLELLTPLIHSLIHIHKSGLIHRDISPDNLILGMDNHLHLIDFGAAIKKDFQAKNKNTIILKSGYAPPEQYLNNEKTGAWVDVYALCATTYFALTGTAPVPAIQRLQKDTLQPLSMTIAIQPWQSAAIEKGLQLHQANRFRDMEELYQALTVPSYLEKTPTVALKANSLKRKWQLQYIVEELSTKKKISAFLLILLIILSTLLGRIMTPAENIPSGKKVTSTLSSPTPSSLAEQTPADTNSEAKALSVSPELLTMPDITEISFSKAKKKLQKLDSNIHIETKKVYNKKVPSNHVISQNIAEGTLFNSGQIPIIQLTISLGKKPETDSANTAASTPSVPSKTSTPKASNKQKSSPKPTYNVKAAEDEYSTIYRD